MKSDKSKGRFRQAFTREKIIRFIDKQGFYVVLFVCIAIIGVTAFFTSNKSPKPQVQDLADNEKVFDLPEPVKPDGLDAAGLLDEKISIKIKDSTLPAEEDKDSEEVLKETLASQEDKKMKRGKSQNRERARMM